MEDDQQFYNRPQSLIDSPLTTVTLLILVVVTVAVMELALGLVGKIGTLNSQSTEDSVNVDAFTEKFSSGDVFTQVTYKGDLVNIVYGGADEEQQGRIDILDRYSDFNNPQEYSITTNRPIGETALFFYYSLETGLQRGPIAEFYDRVRFNLPVTVTAVKAGAEVPQAGNYDFITTISLKESLIFNVD